LADGEEIPSYRGDNVNGYEKHLRQPDPNRIVEGYFHSAATINYARVVIAEGLGDLRKADAWKMEFVQNAKRRTVYENISKKIVNAMEFIETCGVALDSALKSIDMFTSHEGLHLDYEEAMTTQTEDGKYYNTGAHFLWIGDRTRQLDHAHVEYFRGISNPIGIKVGPTSKPDELIAMIRTLWPDPEAEPGRITLISRFGAHNVQAMLPPLLKAVKEADPPLPVVWISDPMHGNTTTSQDGLKTRSFNDVLKEVEECINVHSSMGSFLAGVHFELTGDNVTECTGGPENLTDKDLPLRYTTLCDPRLNYAQSIEVAFRLAEHIVESKNVRPGLSDPKSPLPKRVMSKSNLAPPSPNVNDTNEGKGKRVAVGEAAGDAKRLK
jgi:3-deoxy-7-phosphoheptulonate synthase